MAPQLIVEMTADEAKVFASQQKVIRQQEQMIAKYKELAQAGKQQTDVSERAGQSQEKAFGPEKQAGLERFKGLLTGVAGVAATLGPAFAASAAELSKNFELIRGAEGSLAQLAQLATNREEFQSLQAEARQLYAKGAAPDLNTAATQLFSLISAELNKGDRQFLASLGASGFVADTGELAKSINTLQTTLGAAAGNARDIVNAGIAASAKAPSTVPELLAGTARAAGTAGRLGFRPEEVLAATTFASKATGSAEIGGTQILSLMTAIGENMAQFQGMDLAAIVREIQGRQLDQQGLQQLFGREEAIAGFSTLATNLESFTTLQREILQAQRDNLVAGRVGLIEQDTTLRNLQRGRVAEARASLSDEARAAERALFQQVLEENVIGARRSRGGFELFNGMNRAAAAVVQTVGMERPVLEAWRLRSRLSGGELQHHIARELHAIDRMRESSRMQGQPAGIDREAAQMQLEAARMQLQAVQHRPAPQTPALPQSNPARAEQSHLNEIGK